MATSASSITDLFSWDALVVHFSEIALKGGNRRNFTKKLHSNLKRALSGVPKTVQFQHDRIYIHPEPGHLPDALERASKVFGVENLAPIKFLEKDVREFCKAGVEAYQAFAPPGGSFGVQVKRSDKTFAMRSMELQRRVGQAVIEATEAPVNLSNPDLNLKFRISASGAYLEGPKVQGPSGLPCGVSGKVLTLFSGGIDSPAAAWLIMRRGCLSQFIHFHVFRSGDEVRESKIPQLVEKLVQPQGYRTRLYLVPYHPFQFALLKHPIPEELELVIFRRFMIRTADRLAKREGLDALVTGDNLGQVASQTMRSLNALEGVAERPVFRPLLTHSKNEIIEITRAIGTFEQSVEDYKDCCSLVAKHPDTRPSKNRVQGVESELPVDTISDEALAATEMMII